MKRENQEDDHSGGTRPDATDLDGETTGSWTKEHGKALYARKDMETNSPLEFLEGA